MRGNSSRAERYRKLAVKYHELGKFARPAYLGDFYRGVAVRYTFMAQEASERVRKQSGLGAEALRHGKVVSSTGLKKFRPSHGVLSLPLNRSQWPTKVKFV